MTLKRNYGGAEDERRPAAFFYFPRGDTQPFVQLQLE